MRSVYKTLIWMTLAYACVVVVVGAYVRLSDAGLGCPDWPGCYGAVSPEHAQEDIARAVEAQGGTHGPVSLAKAWKEMFHRYIAGGLGILILTINVMAWRWQRSLGQSPWLATTLLGVLMLQAALGMWTVTLLLKPAVVTLHLMGGMTTLALLFAMGLRQSQAPRLSSDCLRLRPWAITVLLMVILQIVLGGWVSSNYAALACVDFPTCHGQWWPEMEFRQGFHWVRELGLTATGEYLSHAALTAIHWAHRLGAAAVFVAVLSLALALVRFGARAYGFILVGILLLQVSLGIANVLGSLPLFVAVAHNAGAAGLLLAMVMINWALYPRRMF